MGLDEVLGFLKGGDTAPAPEDFTQDDAYKTPSTKDLRAAGITVDFKSDSRLNERASKGIHPGTMTPKEKELWDNYYKKTKLAGN
ncbi:MAG: hypothetical protein KDA17_00635 [Candidatus Saccharibacteria bacterium]|nr:hypothetical protein [Candidatus Saccharibacteria bacterium]